MFGENSSDDIFVDLDPESKCDDVCDARRPITRIELLQFNDGGDQFPRWTFGPWSSEAFITEQAAIFTFEPTHGEI